MRLAVHVLGWLGPGLLAAAAAAQTRMPVNPDKHNLFLAAWLAEQLDRDAPAALELYRRAAKDTTQASSQRALALARLGELQSMRGRAEDLQQTYRALAGLGIDPRNPIASSHVAAMGRLSKQFQDALQEPEDNERDRALRRARQRLWDYLDRARRAGRNPRRAVTLRPLVQRVVQHERRPREQVEDQELQELRQQRLKALEQGNQSTARQLLQQINQKRNQLPSRNVSIVQRTRGKRMAWITELHLRNETEKAQRRERMLFSLPRAQENQVKRQLRFLRRRATEGQRQQALTIVRHRVRQVAERPAISQWEREVLGELDTRLGEYAENDEVMEALELIARLPYRHELLQDLPRGR